MIDINEMLCEDEETLLADGFEEAIIGLAHPWQSDKQAVVIYDAMKCIEILMRDHDLDHAEAMEYFEYNCTGAYVGGQTPIYVWTRPYL